MGACIWCLSEVSDELWLTVVLIHQGKVGDTEEGSKQTDGVLL